MVALTATATTQVQQDIVTQLGLGCGREPAVFIHGFRRDNLAIEVVEVSKPKRAAFAAELLADRSARPAIVYAPTRKDAEMLAGELGRAFKTASYHAGLDPDTRERVQRAFLAGELEVVVATIAFGMGIDKADVRTVLHAALPATLEGYYQEIGRAGRDGLLSRTILMHSFADRRQHDFFYERDYPPQERLDAIYRCLGTDPVHWEELPELIKRREKLLLDDEAFDKALEKLVTHGGAVMDYSGFVTRGSERWRGPYLAQSDHRGGQMKQVIRYAESGECRMAQLVRHFGDTEDGRADCGICDVCAPDASVTQTARPLSDSERRLAHAVVGALGGSGYGGGSKPTGKLQGELCDKNGMSRDAFEDLGGALASAGFLRLEEAAFEKDGRTIPYRKASLTHEGASFSDRDAETVVMRELNGAAGGSSPKRERTRKPAARSEFSRGPGARSEAQPLTGATAALGEKLRAWRKGEAQKLGQPAFCVFADRTLRAIAEEHPASEDDLLSIAGLGPAKVSKFGEGILRVCAGAI